MEEHEKRQRDFERYNAILELTTDPAARTAIKDLIRQTCDRLARSIKPSTTAHRLKTLGPPPRLKAVAAALWGRPLKVELAKFCKTRSDI